MLNTVIYIYIIYIYDGIAGIFAGENFREFRGFGAIRESFFWGVNTPLKVY